MQTRLGVPNLKVNIIQFSPNQSGANFYGMETWNTRLKKARLARGFYILADFAAAVKVQPASAHDWESGKTKSLKVPTLKAICKELKIREDWLLCGEGEMIEQPQQDATQVPELSQVDKMIIELLPAITESQKHDFLKTLESQKQANERMFLELLELRKTSQAA